MGLWSLQDLDHIISLDRAAYHNSPAEHVLPGFHNRDPKFGVPLPGTSNAAIHRNSDIAKPQIPISHSQIQVGEAATRVTHPTFIERLKQSRRDLEEMIVPFNLPPPSSWKPASTNVTFGEFFLPPPHLPANVTSTSTSTSTRVVILVLSAHQNFERRQAIRETWADGVIYFVVGHSKCNTTIECLSEDHNLLLQEQLLYHDLLEIPMVESYDRLPEKVIQAYHWTLQHIPSVQWLVKADDDTFVRPSTLQQYLRKYNPTIPMWIGKMIPHSRVARSGKWADHDFLSDFYPYWAIGSAGHIISRAVAEYVIQESARLHRYQGEDVSLGIWLNQWDEQVTYIQAERMITNDGIRVCGSPRYLMIGHDLTLDEVYECYLQFFNTTVFKENTWLEIPADFEDLVRLEEGFGLGSLTKIDTPMIPEDVSVLSSNGGGGGSDKVSMGDTPPSLLGFERVTRGRAIGYSFPGALRDHMAKKH